MKSSPSKPDRRKETSIYLQVKRDIRNGDSFPSLFHRGVNVKMCNFENNCPALSQSELSNFLFYLLLSE